MPDRDHTPTRRSAFGLIARNVLDKFAGASLAVAILSVGSSLVTTYWATGHRQQESASIETELNKTLQGMESNARQASKLMERLQAEVAARAQALREAEVAVKELQKQRSLLDLTNEQRNALKELVGRNPSIREIFTSLDFWFGRFMVSLCFFALGVWFTLWRSRKEPPSVPSREVALLQEQLGQINQSIARLVADKRLAPEDADRLRRIHPAYLGEKVGPILPPPQNFQSTQDDQQK